ncbi:hypothetical protein [Cutibacterium granulosum]|uniref:hypothetical protein n=1 Tax=Cutibacterium granulosum TaxID=33011 RepID=UPI002B22FAF4|nr:hypothetical protein [Cutibacterium granulosum]MEA5642829.1 hypothetical protein [Cutibacterium granulosum]
MMNSDRPTGDYSALSSGLVVLLLVLIIMAATGKSFATAPGGSVLHTTIFAVVAAVACILGLIASVRGPGSRASRMVHGIGCVVLAGGIVSFLAFTDPTTINVFGLCAVIVGFIAMLVGTAMIHSIRR